MMMINTKWVGCWWWWKWMKHFLVAQHNTTRSSRGEDRRETWRAEDHQRDAMRATDGLTLRPPVPARISRHTHTHTHNTVGFFFPFPFYFPFLLVSVWLGQRLWVELLKDSPPSPCALWETTTTLGWDVVLLLPIQGADAVVKTSSSLFWPTPVSPCVSSSSSSLHLINSCLRERWNNPIITNRSQFPISRAVSWQCWI